MVLERAELEGGATTAFVELITSSSEHIEAYGTFFVITFMKSARANKGLPKQDSDYIRVRFLEAAKPGILRQYDEIEKAFAELNVDLKDASAFLTEINRNERVIAMRQKPAPQGGQK